MNIAEASPKGLEHFWQKPQMRGDRKSDRQMADGVAAQLFYFLLGPAHVVEDCRGPPDEGLTQRRRYHAFGASLEQRGADFALQFGQAASEARLRSAAARRLPCSAMATAPRKWLSFMQSSQDHS